MTSFVFSLWNVLSSLYSKNNNDKNIEDLEGQIKIETSYWALYC